MIIEPGTLLLYAAENGNILERTVVLEVFYHKSVPSGEQVTGVFLFMDENLSFKRFRGTMIFNEKFKIVKRWQKHRI